MMGKHAADDNGLASQLIGVFREVQFFHLQLNACFTEFFYLLPILFVGKIADDAFGDSCSDFVYLHQIVQRSRCQLVDAPEGFRQGLGRRFSHKADAQSE